MKRFVWVMAVWALGIHADSVRLKSGNTYDVTLVRVANDLAYVIHEGQQKTLRLDQIEYLLVTREPMSADDRSEERTWGGDDDDDFRGTDRDDPQAWFDDNVLPLYKLRTEPEKHRGETVIAVGKVTHTTRGIKYYRVLLHGKIVCGFPKNADKLDKRRYYAIQGRVIGEYTIGSSEPELVDCRILPFIPLPGGPEAIDDFNRIKTTYR